jgi:hypothetical protein
MNGIEKLGLSKSTARVFLDLGLPSGGNLQPPKRLHKRL